MTASTDIGNQQILPSSRHAAFCDFIQSVESDDFSCDRAHPGSECNLQDLPPPTKFPLRSKADQLSSANITANMRRKALILHRASIGRIIAASESADWSGFRSGGRNRPKSLE